MSKVWSSSVKRETTVSRDRAVDVRPGRKCLHERLGELVERLALGSAVQGDESRNPELLAGLGNSLHPASVLHALAVLELFLGHQPPALGQAQILLGQAALGIDLATIPYHAHAARLALLGYPLGRAHLGRVLRRLGLL